MKQRRSAESALGEAFAEVGEALVVGDENGLWETGGARGVYDPRQFLGLNDWVALTCENRSLAVAVVSAAYKWYGLAWSFLLYLLDNLLESFAQDDCPAIREAHQSTVRRRGQPRGEK